jgi:hypothetical protein
MRTLLCLAAACVLVLAGCKPSTSEKPGTPPAKSTTPAEPTPAPKATSMAPMPETYPDARYYDSTNAWAKPALARPTFYDTPTAVPVSPKVAVTRHAKAPVVAKAAKSKTKLAARAHKPSTKVASKAARHSVKTVAMKKKSAIASSKTPRIAKASSPAPKPVDKSDLAI